MMFYKSSTQYLSKYYLTAVFTLLAVTSSWALVRTIPQYVFFILFNFITIFYGEYLINKAYVLHTKKYNIFKGILGGVQLLISCIILEYFSM